MRAHAGRVFIKTFGSLIGGEKYSLECFTGETAATFLWLSPGQPVNESSVFTSSNSSTSQLLHVHVVRPLQQSHNGLYSCSATTDVDTLLSEPVEINVKGKWAKIFIAFIINT